MNGGPLTRLDKRNGPDYTEIWSVRQGYRIGAETSITVSVTGAHLRATIDGASLFDVNDGEFRSGKIGLFCYAQAGQAFTDVKVVHE